MEAPEGDTMGRSKSEKRLEELLMHVHRCRQAPSEAKQDNKAVVIPERALLRAYARLIGYQNLIFRGNST